MLVKGDPDFLKTTIITDFEFEWNIFEIWFAHFKYTHNEDLYLSTKNTISILDVCIKAPVSVIDVHLLKQKGLLSDTFSY